MRKNELRKWRENYTPYNSYCLGEGLKLHVHYEEKDFVKDIGGRWCPDKNGRNGYSRTVFKSGYWWMPAHMLDQKLGPNIPAIVNIFDPKNSDDDYRDDMCNGLTTLEWLNDNKMIARQYGDVTESEGLLEAISNSTATEHPCVLRGTKIGTFYVWSDLDVASFSPRDQNPKFTVRNWYTLDKAREVWDNLSTLQRQGLEQ